MCLHKNTHFSGKNVKPLSGKMWVNQLWVSSAPLCTCTCISLCSNLSATPLTKSSHDLLNEGAHSKEWVTIFIWVSLTPGGNEGRGGTVQFCECSVCSSHAKKFYFYWDNFWVGDINSKTSIPAGHLLKWALEGEQGDLVQPWLSPGNKRINTRKQGQCRMKLCFVSWNSVLMTLHTSIYNKYICCLWVCVQNLVKVYIFIYMF